MELTEIYDNGQVTAPPGAKVSSSIKREKYVLQLLHG
jgi:hypothetical protein